MVRSLPDDCWVHVEPEVARALHAAARAIAPPALRDLYDVAVQDAVRRAVQNRCPEAFADVTARIEMRLRQPPFAVVVRGLEHDEHHLLFLALVRRFGVAIAGPYDPPRGQLIHRIQPATDIRATRGVRHESERLHTDCADWRDPAQYLAMVCVRPDLGGGGRSRLLDAPGLRRTLGETLDDDAIRWLERTPLPWRLADHLGRGVVRRPVLSPSSMCWRRYTIDAGLQEAGEQLSTRETAILDDVDTAVCEAPDVIEFQLEAGDMLLADNLRALHSRTPLSAHSSASDRLMLRSWIQPS